MKMILVCSVVALLACVGSVIGAPILDGMNLPYNAATVDIEGQEGETAWAGGSWRVLDGATSMVPTNWKYSQSSWNGSNNYHVEADTVSKTEGTASAKMTPGSGGYNDIFAGRMVDVSAYVGTVVTISFDFQADIGFRNQNGPGQGTGDDHVNSASWNFKAVPDSPQGWADTEDYPGHLTGSVWINDRAHWDGNWHHEEAQFFVSNSPMAFVLKFRSMDPAGSPAFRLDNLVIPEPASLALLGLGGLFVLRRKR